METFKAKVKFEAKEPKEGQYGPYISVCVVPFGADEEDKSNWINVYGNPDDSYMKSLKWKNDVTVAVETKNDKKVYKLIPPPANGNGEPRKKTYLDPPSKKKKQNPETMKKYIDGHMELLTYAIEKSRETWKDDLNAGADVIFKTAVTVYISMKEYFNV